MTTNPVNQNKKPVALPTLAVAAFLALAVMVSPSQARADSGDAAAAVLLGAAIVYAAHESHDNRHRQKVDHRVYDRRVVDHHYHDHRYYDRGHDRYYRNYGHQKRYYPSSHGRYQDRHDYRQTYRNDWKHHRRDDHGKNHGQDRDRGHGERNRGEKHGKQMQASVHMHQRF